MRKSESDSDLSEELKKRKEALELQKKEEKLDRSELKRLEEIRRLEKRGSETESRLEKLRLAHQDIERKSILNEVDNHHGKSYWALNWKITFSLALIAGLCAVMAAVLILYASWSAVTFNSSSFYSQAQQILASTYGNTSANYTQGITAASFLISLTVGVKNASLLFVPIVAIAGALLLLTAFYFRSRYKRTVLYGTIFAAVFSMAAFIAILSVVPISSDTVAVLFGYLGTYSGTNALVVALAFGLFLAYMVFGLLAAAFGIYRLSMMPEHQ